MNAWKQIWVRRVVRAELFSPMWFVGRALLITIFYFLCNAAGLREQTTFLSGTAAGAGTSLNSSAVLGMTYLVAYFGFVLVAPIFLLAALLMIGFQRKKMLCTLLPGDAHEVKAIGIIKPAVNPKESVSIEDSQPQKKPSEILARGEQTACAESQKSQVTHDD